MSTLGDLRDKERNQKREFERRKAREWAAEVADTRDEIRAEVNRLYAAGWSVRQIMIEYGTKDFRTVKDMIDPDVVPDRPASKKTYHADGPDGNGFYTVEGVTFSLIDGDPVVANSTNPVVLEALQNGRVSWTD